MVGIKTPNVLKCSSQRSDLNLNKNLWQDLKTIVHQCFPSNLTQLKKFWHEKCAEISGSTCAKLTDVFQKTCSCNHNQRWFYLLFTKRDTCNQQISACWSILIIVTAKKKSNQKMSTDCMNIANVSLPVCNTLE